jgi:hypothetical protein
MRRHIPQRMMEQAMAQRNRSISLKPGKARAALTITHPNAAGIDIGSASHLSGAFRPADPVCVLRSLWRQRAMLLRSQARHVQHMQKAVTQMNIQLTNVISARSSPSATARSKRNCKAFKLMTASRPRARSVAARATRPSSIFAYSCSRCAAWTSRASTAST